MDTASTGEDSSNGDAKLVCVICGNPARLQCPKCLELKLPHATAAFCSQECFKGAWANHKSAHKVTAGGDANPVATAALENGWLYPIKKGQLRTATMPHSDWTGPVEEPMSQWQNSVEVKSAEQIARLRKTCRVAREVLDAAARAVRPGITTDELDRIVHEKTIELGAYPSPLNYYFFPKSTCTSVNEVICHGIPDARVLEDGDIVNVDVSVYLHGCHGDLNETYFVGKVDEEAYRLVKATQECLQKGIDAVKPGVRFREIGEVVSRHASKAPFSVVKSYCGHGIGELFHCAPNIPHYAKNKAVGVMKVGQTFTIEPMINAGVWRDRLWPDGWTSVTCDGKRSAQFEHTLLVTEDGCEVLTARLPSSPKVFDWLKP